MNSGGCQNGQARTFSYDSLSRRLTANNPESGSFSYTYDGNGNLTKRVEGGRGITATPSYNALNRVTGISYSDGVTPNVTYTWDTASGNGIGQLQPAASSNGVTASFGGYDGLGNVLQSTEQVGTKVYAFGYTYNLASELATETYPSGRIVSVGYDQAGRETNVTGTLFM